MAHYNVPQSPDNLGFDVGSFEFGSRGLKAAARDDLALPEAEDEDDDLEGAEVPMGVDLDDQEVRFEVGIPIPDRIHVNDIELAAESPLRALRAACAFYKIDQSGGKARRFKRLVEHQGTLELMRARDLTKSAEAALARRPVEQAIAKTPSKEEQRLHDLTHLPYAAWCECCVKHRARPDQRRRSAQAREAGPAISFDYAYTHASGIGPLGAPEADDGAQMGVADDESGALWLIAVCAETGYVLGLPLKAKSQLNLIAHELLSFTQVLGHEEVAYTTLTTSLP